MDPSQPKTNPPQPRPQAHTMQNALPVGAAPMPEKTITDDTVAADTPHQSSKEESPGQDCPFLRLPTELRLEISRLASQNYLNVVKSAPKFYGPRPTPFHGSLALLHTCRTFRVEGIDAMESLAQASRSTLESVIAQIKSKMMAMNANNPTFGAVSASYTRSLRVLIDLQCHLKATGEACSVLAIARKADKQRNAG